MFREMRRKNNQMTTEESTEILIKGEYGMLSTICPDGYPYTTPLNYVYYNNSIYIHSATEGQKIDNIKECNKVSFCVVADTEIVPEKFDTNYKSVVLFGKAKEVKEHEKYEALLELVKKYSNQFMEQGKGTIKDFDAVVKVMKIEIEHITGKAK